MKNICFLSPLGLELSVCTTLWPLRGTSCDIWLITANRCCRRNARFPLQSSTYRNFKIEPPMFWSTLILHGALRHARCPGYSVLGWEKGVRQRAILCCRNCDSLTVDCFCCCLSWSSSGQLPSRCRRESWWLIFSFSASVCHKHYPKQGVQFDPRRLKKLICS